MKKSKLFWTFIFLISLFLLVGCGRHKYTIYVYPNNDESEYKIELAEGALIDIKEPTKRGHTFAGWYNDEGDFNLKEMPGYNFLIYARFNPNIYKIKLEENGGNEVEDLLLEFNTEINLPNIVRDGYVFRGWYDDDGYLFSYMYMLDHDFVLYAKWSKIIKVTFETDGGTNYDPILCLEGNLLPDLPIPAKSGYKFAGWYKDVELENPLTLTHLEDTDLKLYAKWELLNSNLTYNYITDEDAYEVTGYSGTDETVSIPRMYNGKSVIKIADNAFLNNSNIMNVVFEKESMITSIGDNSFANIKMPLSIEIPKSVEIIGYQAFDGSNLYSITFEDESNLKTISFQAFYNNRFITIDIPSKVSFIGTNNFFNYELESIKVDAQNSYYSSVDGVLFNKDKTVLIKCPQNKSGSFTISNTVKYLESMSFAHTTNLDYIYFEKNTFLTAIPDYSFIQTGIKSITIPKEIKSIGKSAFGYCRNLSEVLFEEGSLLETIYEEAFSNIAITTITIGDNVSFISIDSFSQSKKLIDINVSLNNLYFSDIDGVLYNKDQTELLVYPAGNTKNEFTVPSSVKKIKSDAFLFIENLKVIDFEEGSQLKEIEFYAFFGASIESITIPKDLSMLILKKLMLMKIINYLIQ